MDPNEEPIPMILPKGIVVNTDSIYPAISALHSVPTDFVALCWHTYHATTKELLDPTARRLENFWWRIWGSDRSDLPGAVVSRIFEDISDGPTFVRLRGPDNRWEPPENYTHSARVRRRRRRQRRAEAGESAGTEESPDATARPAPPPRAMSASSTGKPLHPILKKGRGSSGKPTGSGPRPTTRFILPGEEGSVDAAGNVNQPSGDQSSGGTTMPGSEAPPPTVAGSNDDAASSSPDETDGNEGAPKRPAGAAAAARRRPPLPRRKSSHSSTNSEGCTWSSSSSSSPATTISDRPGSPGEKSRCPPGRFAHSPMSSSNSLEVVDEEREEEAKCDREPVLSAKARGKQPVRPLFWTQLLHCQPQAPPQPAPEHRRQEQPVSTEAIDSGVAGMRGRSHVLPAPIPCPASPSAERRPVSYRGADRSSPEEHAFRAPHQLPFRPAAAVTKAPCVYSVAPSRGHRSAAASSLLLIKPRCSSRKGSSAPSGANPLHTGSSRVREGLASGPIADTTTVAARGIIADHEGPMRGSPDPAPLGRSGGELQVLLESLRGPAGAERPKKRMGLW